MRAIYGGWWWNSAKRQGALLVVSLCVLLTFFVSQAFAGTKSFTWSDWVGGSHQSSRWDASSGTQTWVKETCVGGTESDSGSFTVRIYRNRSLLPDVDVGTRTFECDDTTGSREYDSDSSGQFYFTFPTVSTQSGEVSGSGRVTYP